MSPWGQYTDLSRSQRDVGVKQMAFVPDGDVKLLPPGRKRTRISLFPLLKLEIQQQLCLSLHCGAKVLIGINTGPGDSGWMSLERTQWPYLHSDVMGDGLLFPPVLALVPLLLTILANS